MAQSRNFDLTYDRYSQAFRAAEMPSTAQMSVRDFNRLETMMEVALERGTPITEDDLLDPITPADPETGLVA